MLLISALALGLVESTNPNLSHIDGYNVATTGGGAISNRNMHQTNIPGHNVAGILDAGAPTNSNIWNSFNGTLTKLNGANNGGLNTITIGDWSIEQCLIWQGPNELYFQLGNAFFFLAFIAPHNLYGLLWLRSFLCIGCVLMGTYGLLIECRPDVILWSALFLSINFIYLIVLLCRLRPIRFEKDIEAVYKTLFKPLKVSRYQFKKVLSCMKLIRSLKYQEIYAQEKVTKVDSLSLVLSGKLVVSQNQRALHIVFPHQFLDSPEWFGVSTDDYFQVSIMAMEESRVLIWHRDKLKLSIMGDEFLQSVFDHVLGRDVVKKLMQVTQVNETMASNGFLPTGNYDDGENKPMICIKTKTDGHGLTALINRQLQEEQAPLLGRAQPKRIRLSNSNSAQQFTYSPLTSDTKPKDKDTKSKTLPNSTTTGTMNNSGAAINKKQSNKMKTSNC